MINWKTATVILGLIVCVAYFAFDNHSSKAKGRIEVYEQQKEDLERTIEANVRYTDSLNNIIVYQELVMDSIKSITVKKVKVYIKRKEKRNEKINRIVDMSSDDKYGFFADR